jgi:leucyl aminopeptidase (aminopeptidase T)
MDALPRELSLRLAELQTVEIQIVGLEDPDLLKGVPDERIATLAKQLEPVYQRMVDRSVRTAILYNGLYPTADQAAQLGVTVAQLERIFWGALAGDSARLTAVGEALRSKLRAGEQLKITNPNGTELVVGVAGRKVFVNDGVISDADLAEGGAAVTKYLPAGEVYFSPALGRADGKLVVDRFPWEDGEITQLTATVEGGRITAMTGEPAELLERFAKYVDAMGPRARELAAVDFGINAEVKFPEGTKPLTYVPSGMVSFVLGGNSFLGGDNPTLLNWSWFLPGSTVTLDGEILVDEGVLQVAAQ